MIFYVTFSHQSKGSDLSKTILKKLLPFVDLPEHSPLTNSASTLTPILRPQWYALKYKILLIYYYKYPPTLKYKILFPDSLQRAERKSSLASLISLPFPPSPTQREKTLKSHQNTEKKTQKNSKKCRDSVIREDRTKNFNKFLLSLSHSFSPLLFLFRFQFSLHFLCSQTSTGAITKG